MKKVLILGLGNILLGDEGLGIRALKELEEDFIFEEGTELLDGGTGAFFLLPYLEKTDYLLVIDAIKTGASPGSVIFESIEKLPQETLEKLSLHEVSLLDLLHLLEFKGKKLEKIVIAGIEPKRLEVGTSLSSEVEKSLPCLKEMVLQVLRSWGINYFPKRFSEKRTP